MTNLEMVRYRRRVPGRDRASDRDLTSIGGGSSDTPPVCLKCARSLLTVRPNAQVDITIRLYLRVRVGMGCKAGCDQRPPYRQGCGRDEGRQAG